jgi:hypothetical protein
MRGIAVGDKSKADRERDQILGRMLATPPDPKASKKKTKRKNKRKKKGR